MNEIAQALRDRSRALAPRYDALGLRAADEIERLEAELAKRHSPSAPTFDTEPIPLKRRGRPPKAR
jgi:hypothetical protein